MDANILYSTTLYKNCTFAEDRLYSVLYTKRTKGIRSCRHVLTVFRTWHYRLSLCRFLCVLGIKFVGRTSRGHTGFLIHLLSAVRALIFLARRIQRLLSPVDREVEFWNFVVFFFGSHWSLVDVPLISFCPADHVPDWQPRILLGMVEARSVNVKKTTTLNRLASILA